MATPAQIEANRRNALKSTGPRTAEGKAASRRNAIQHGLASETLVMPDEEAPLVAARMAIWSETFRPRYVHERWLVGEVVIQSVRIDRCQGNEVALRARAALCWDEDRAAEAEELGAKLSRSPALVSRQLRRSKHGCAWLIARWEGLRGVLDAGGAWDATHTRLALDLIGTPKEFRGGPSPLDGDRPALVAQQIARLEASRVGALDELDERDRAAAEVGLGDPQDKAVKLVRRYEAACIRRMEWAQKQLAGDRKAGARRPEVAPPDPSPRELSRMTAMIAPEPRPLPPAARPLAPTQSDAPENRRSRRARKALARRA